MRLKSRFGLTTFQGPTVKVLDRIERGIVKLPRFGGGAVPFLQLYRSDVLISS